MQQNINISTGAGRVNAFPGQAASTANGSGQGGRVIRGKKKSAAYQKNLNGY
jgi:hypothetical protein